MTIKNLLISSAVVFALSTAFLTTGWAQSSEDTAPTEEPVLTEDTLMTEEPLITDESVPSEMIENNVAEAECVSQAEIDAMSDEDKSKLELPVCDEGEMVLECVPQEELEAMSDEDKAKMDLPVCSDEQMATECIPAAEFESMTDEDKAQLTMPICE
jgi:hypothetical protein